MLIIYVRIPNLYFAIDDHKIFGIQKNHERIINPHAIIVDALGATPFSDKLIESGIFYLHGLMIARLAKWVSYQYPKLGYKAYGEKLVSLFDNGNNVLLPETLKAVCRVISNTIPASAGDEHYFANEQWKQHPKEFAALMLAHLLRRRD